ncbi:lipopolysaccharide kinase InaA family protein [Pseudomonas sp. St316]|uniref:lipopolysaccharide kinase InaA family protein n=1 Tax=Pseudomonas sp. St316 TaxID=2678257 RepID=UPI001BB359B7|nr:lipopolysaccharide kinase InaA family protein [Pseudomonas sp. St316]BBP57007.1 toluene tolerance protein [Pseudomonas sp. St316]
MQTLNHSSYLALREGAKVLEADGSGDKVLLLQDGRYLKLFRRKRLFTSALLLPYACRFAHNTEALLKRDIPCPTVLGVYRIASIARDAVYYSPLEGQTIRHLKTVGEEVDTLRFELGAFIARLHEKGVYFRSLHFGNVVLTPENTLGLIDIADLRCQRRALSDTKRLRNFAHLLRYKEDRHWLLERDAGADFIEGYSQGLPANRRTSLINALRLLLA